MSEVKWIKITTDMFENRKIRYLRKLPDGNNIVLIWVMLLSIAGKCNSNGMIFLTENVPYTTKMLADELDFEENTVILAIEALERLGMIRRDEYLFIEDWVAHQNADGLDKIREQGRKRVAAYRERQKALCDNVQERDVTLCNVTERDNVTQCNAPRIRVENKNKSIEEDNIVEEVSQPQERTRKAIPPTIDEVREYCESHGYNIDPQHFVDHYTANGWMVGRTKMKDWQATVRTWVANDKKRGGTNRGYNSTASTGNQRRTDIPHVSGVPLD